MRAGPGTPSTACCRSCCTSMSHRVNTEDFRWTSPELGWKTKSWTNFDPVHSGVADSSGSPVQPSLHPLGRTRRLALSEHMVCGSGRQLRACSLSSGSIRTYVQWRASSQALETGASENVWLSSGSGRSGLARSGHTVARKCPVR